VNFTSSRFCPAFSGNVTAQLLGTRAQPYNPKLLSNSATCKPLSQTRV